MIRMLPSRQLTRQVPLRPFRRLERHSLPRPSIITYQTRRKVSLDGKLRWRIPGYRTRRRVDLLQLRRSAFLTRLYKLIGPRANCRVTYMATHLITSLR